MRHALLALLGLFCCCGTLAQSSSRFAISRNVVAGGGATFSSTSRFELGSTIAQPLAAVPVGSRFSIQGGFWIWPAPSMSLRVEMGTNIIISFRTEPGRRYTLGHADSITVPSWQTLASVLGDGTTKSVTDASPRRKQRYYRLMEE